MNEVIKYSNRLNSLILKDFSDLDLRVFFAIVSRLREHGTDPVTFTYEYLKKLTNEKRHMTQDEYGQTVKEMYRKLLGLRFVYSYQDEVSNVEGEYNLFEGFENDRTGAAFTIRVTASFAYMFNELQNNFTAFSLDEFVNLPGGIYTKQLYRQLKQWRSVGHVSYMISDLRLLMDIPEGYPMSEVTRKVIDPAVQNLRKSVKEFRTLTYSYTRKNRSIVSVKFSWTPEPRKRRILHSANADNRPYIQKNDMPADSSGQTLLNATETVSSEEQPDADFFARSKNVDREWLEMFFGISDSGE